MQQHRILLWAGRIGGLLVTAFFGLFILGEGLPDILKGAGRDLLRFLPFTLLTLAGFGVAWFKPLTGGKMLLGGALLMGAFFLYTGDTVMGLVYVLPSLLTGLCFIGAANKELI
ncbi:MAG: hypothetical protein IAE96_07145 [Chitinophagaceae bacterium]|nr:hypothetical protein [Chitinophagaceae bacterium]